VIFVRNPIARGLIAAGAALAAAIGIALALFARPAAAQGTAPLQVAYVLSRGADTAIVERVTIGRETISGHLFSQGTPSVSYVATVVATPSGPSVPTLTFRVFGPGAPADAAPLQVGSMKIGADSATVEAGTGAGPGQRATVAVSGSPLPLLNGSMAMANLMIARARLSADRPYKGKFHFLQGPGVPLDATIEFVGADSVTVSLAGAIHRFAIDAAGQITGGAIPSQGVVISRASGAAAAGISLGRPDYNAPADAPYRSEEVTVPTPKGHTLSGTLTIPRSATGRIPAVVTITGSGQQDRDEYIPIVPNFRPFRQLADTLGRRGVAVLRLDDRGINSSGGDVNGTSADFADDIRAALAYLRARPDIDGGRIALAGHSEGGMIAPMVAATDSKLAGIVLLAGPAYPGGRILDFQLRNLVMGNTAIPAAKKDSAARASRAQWDSTSGKSPWMRYFVEYDPIPTLKKVKVPVLILQGGTDQQVTPDQAPIIEQTLKAAGNRDVTMRVFPARNHLFLPDSVGYPGNYGKIRDGRIGPDVMGPAADWIVLKLSTSPTRP
jgi:dienelactone hydrolase